MDERLKDRHDQLLTFWRWYKAQPYPDPQKDDGALLAVCMSGNELIQNDQRLLLRMLVLGALEEIENDFIARREALNA